MFDVIINNSNFFNKNQDLIDYLRQVKYLCLKAMKNSKIVPNTRLNKFFSQEDWDVEISLSREMLEGDGNFTVILYRVDRNTTQYDNLYGEGAKNGIKYFPPVELKVMPLIGEPENKAYNKNGSARYLQDGPLTFDIYQQQLDELTVDISYGDYIGYPLGGNQIRYYSVANDGKKNFDNKHTIMGYKAAYRTILCAPIDESEFKAI